MRSIRIPAMGLLLGLLGPGCSDREVQGVGWRDPVWPCERGHPVCRSGCGEAETEVGPAEAREGAWHCPPGTWLRCSASPARPCVGVPPAEDAGPDAVTQDR